MIRTILVALYERVFKAYKSTLLGMVLVAGTVVVETLQAEALPTWARTVVGIAATLLALYRGKQAAPDLKLAP